MKLPSFQFYPGDWMKHPGLRRASHTAKGVWIDMMCLMFECEQRGVLTTAGQAWTEEDIIQAVGGDRDVTLQALRELLRLNVAKINKSGAIFSPRMVHDEEIRRIRAEAGKKGGNPGLLKQNGENQNLLKQNLSKTQAKGQAKLKQNPTPSSSPSLYIYTQEQQGENIHPLFTALFQCFGNPKTTQEEIKIRDAMMELERINASPSDLIARVKNYRSKWPKYVCTPNAVLKNWSELGGSNGNGNHHDDESDELPASIKAELRRTREEAEELKKPSVRK